MSLRFGVQNSILIFAFAVLLGFSTCSIPNLEAPECTEARSAVKEFYSFHIGGDMKPSHENLKLREKFLSKELLNLLSASSETEKDYFTSTADFPKAFRIGECEAVSPKKAILQVVLFWRDDDRSEQHELKVESVLDDGKWLVDKVESK